MDGDDSDQSPVFADERSGHVLLEQALGDLAERVLRSDEHIPALETAAASASPSRS